MIRALDGLVLALAALVVSDLVFWWWRPEEVLLVFLGAVAVRAGLRPYPIPTWQAERLVLVGGIAYAILFSFIAVTRHWAFRTHALDLGYYVQVVWSMSQGLGPHVSLPPMHAWGDHFSPTLYLLVPLFALLPRPESLLVMQSVAFGLGALPVFALARRRLGADVPAAAFALLYLLNPTLHGINLRDFHIAAFAIPLLLAAVYLFEAGRMGWFLVATILTLGCREDAALAVVGLGLWIALVRRRWIWGLALVAVSLGVLFVDIKVLMPYLRGEPYPHLHRYTHLGGSLEEILLNMVLHPLRTLGYMLSLEKLRYLLALLAPLAFLPLLAPWDLVPILPSLAHNLVSFDDVLFHHRTQYNSYILPFLIPAAISGYARLSPRLMLHGRPVRALLFGLSFLLSLALTSRTLNDLAVKHWWLTERQRAAYTVLAEVPAGAPVSTHERLLPHLATRSRVFVFPQGLDVSEYVLLDGAAKRDLEQVQPKRSGDEMSLSVQDDDMIVIYRYEVVREVQGYLLLHRLSPDGIQPAKAERAKRG